MGRTIAIGEQNFSEMIMHNSFYIDKTFFIKEWWENRDTVTLITRPRRFGKTLTMNMLYDFFSVTQKDRGDIFQNLDIWKDEKYRKLQGTYPVIFLSFAAVKADNYQKTLADISKLIAREYRRYAFLMDSDGFLQTDRDQYLGIMSGQADSSDLGSSINQLSEYLYNYYGKKVIIILDEYDTPMQEAFVNGYWNEITDFIRSFFNYTFKTNPFLIRGIMTGITRVSRQSVFSDLNNLAVITTSSRLYETAFGFTEEEVFQALEECGMQDQKEEVKHWYDGFTFGKHPNIYNPWSITNFLKFKEFKAYWANTSSNRLIGKLVREGSREMKMLTEDLLEGKSVCAVIDEQLVFNELYNSLDAAWSLMLASGYLKITGYETTAFSLGMEGLSYRLALTNLEIVFAFKKMIREWFAVCSSSYNDFIKALLAGDLESMNAYMNRIALAVFSSFDSGMRPSEKSEPERFYHGFVLGLMVELAGRYEITSNRESGFGRYDVLLKPRSRKEDGIILEFKVFQPGKEKSLEDTAKAAVQQILNRKYASVLESVCGRDRIRVYGFAFMGKEALIDGGCLKEQESRMTEMNAV